MNRIASLLVCLLVLAPASPVRSAAAEGTTVSCAAGERRLYTIVYGRAGGGVRLYCADRTSPAGFIPFGDGRAPEQIDHDRRGNLFVAWEDVRNTGRSGVSILDPSGTLLAERLVPYGAMLVDRTRGVAYLLYARRGGDTVDSAAGHDVRFAHFGTFYRSVGVGSETVEHPVPDVELTKMPVIDPAGRLVIDGYRGPEDLTAIIDPGKNEVVRSVFAPACAMTTGADKLVYAVNCRGDLRVLDPAEYRLLDTRKLDIGGPGLGDTNDPGRLAIDAIGTVFVANGEANTLLRFERGATKPSAVATGVAHVADLQLDSAGNVYVREGGPSATRSSIRVFDGHTLQLIRAYDFASDAVSVYGMTIVDP